MAKEKTIGELKRFFRLITYGWLLAYHLKKQDKFDTDQQPTVLHYHFEMAKYYYKKIYQKPFERRGSHWRKKNPSL